jgi:hypothetical protein
MPFTRMELALQVVGLKTTGKIEDAKNVAMRIVGNAGDPSDSQNGMDMDDMMQVTTEMSDRCFSAVQAARISKASLSAFSPSWTRLWIIRLRFSHVLSPLSAFKIYLFCLYVTFKQNRKPSTSIYRCCINHPFGFVSRNSTTFLCVKYTHATRPGVHE